MRLGHLAGSLRSTRKNRERREGKRRFDNEVTVWE